MSRVVLALQVLIIAAAAALMFAPLPAGLVEHYYSDRFYPALQARLTSWSNDTGVALFDFILLFLIVLLLLLLWRAIVLPVRQRSFAAFARGVLGVLTLLAVVYLWFDSVWGLNYARVPIESAVSYDRARVTPAAVKALAERAVTETNRGYAAGRAAGFPEINAIPPALVASFHQVERELGRPRSTVPGRPKRSALGIFFRASGTDGMHAPFMLETLLNPDLTPPERPAVLAHEWAHLAGFAPEDDASFVGLLAALRADAASRYSAWFTISFEAASQLPPDEWRAVLARFEAGPRQDQEAIVRRQQARIETVQQVSWGTYDQYLKAQGVDEGIRSYSRVVQLLLGTKALEP